MQNKAQYIIILAELTLYYFKKGEITMKKILRTACRFLAATMLMSTATALVAPISAQAESPDAEYEAKKAAYREKLMADDVTTDDILIGSWVSWYSFDIDSWEYQLDQMAAAGINFNMFPHHFGAGRELTEEYWSEVEEEYAKRNMVYQSPGTIDPNLVDDRVSLAAGKEHCIGYHVKDEPTGDQLQTMADIIKLFREADSNIYPFINLFPSYAGETALGGTYYEHVSRFVELAGAENIEYLSHDHYPFLADGSVRTAIFGDMEAVRAVAYENGKLKTHAFPQSTAWNGMRMPNIHEMRWNAYAYLAYGFKALSWFNLVCPGNSDTEGEGFRDSLIYRDGTIRDPELFAAWGELNWEVRGLSSVLMNLDTVHAYHTDKRAKGVEIIPSDFFMKCAGGTRNGGFIVSVMEPKEGDDSYIMIFNKDYEKEDLSGTFTFSSDSGVKWVEYFDPFIGEYIPVELTNGKFSTDFRPGEGRLYRLRYDAPPASTEETTETPVEETTEAPTESTAEATTEAPVAESTAAPVDAVTEAPANDATTVAEETTASGGGCSGTLSLGTLALGLTLLPAVFFRKKKELSD